MTVRKPNPPKLFLSTPPPLDLSPWCSTVLSDCDADDEDTMSGEEGAPSRPLSFSQSSSFMTPGPYCPRIPTLHEILSNVSQPPWTLSAFTAYLSQNHCLETLEFTTDAERYRQGFEKMVAQMTDMPSSPDLDECEHVRMLWRRLIDAYIVPNSPREVNLPSDVRDALLSLPNHTIPPQPEELNVAVKTIYELMDESVLLAFINELSPSRGPPSFNEPWNESEENLHRRDEGRDSMDGSSSHRSRSRRKHSPPTTLTSPLTSPLMSPLTSPPSVYGDHAYSHFNGPSPRLSHNAGLHGLTQSRLSTHASNSSTGSGDPMLTDDSGSPSSPGPMTPPTTPPSSDIAGTSPRSRNDNTWRKMMGRLGSKKKSTSKMGRIEDEPMG